MSTAKETTRYFAVANPSDPTQITFWRDNTHGRTPWPRSAQYAPRLLSKQIPAELRGRARTEWIEAWFREHVHGWFRAVNEAIDADPLIAQARFAVFAIRCCCCGRTLTDPASKAWGIGPECRQGVPDEILIKLSEMVREVVAPDLLSFEASTRGFNAA